ncbi:bifunctional 5,10-methylenetetrahydrofolate dehydrogenase/5,10-methenyltetrahydrofolate cyclohydrolase [Lacticaseibacillus zhaodongensis]|uniref:bifunctional 5,10-methylenetetrahydrofolate dehydrogenase/5,10-methenyltetrahydrofolate cyclohydrolase n=1 Tax=Lacticaseibacillus zhaodongensis TaxID=2668065 RepID=UPI0012D3551D|nr:tetrahydrofolate dehydrogenase/cyclohydrolase catalytic domain-containing protein [Lacticaseibacillus zhaodongensis]
MTVIMKAKPIVAALTDELSTSAAHVTAALGRKPGLTVVLVGDDPASAIYVRNKQKRADQIGVHSDTLRMPATSTQEDVVTAVQKLNADPTVDGIIVQLPLPQQIDADAIINTIAVDKDVDGFTLSTTGRLWNLPKNSPEHVGPCTPLGIMAMLDYYQLPVAGKHAVIVGRSNIVGKPMAAMLLNKGATVTIAHSQTTDLHSLLLTADIIVAATGRRGLITASDVKPGATVIDVGMNRFVDENGKKRLVGDVDYPAVAEVAGAITPVPGGVGPMTVNMLLKQTIAKAASKIQ